MIGLARWCVRRRNVVIGSWLVLLVALGAGLGAAGTAFTDSNKLPASDSATAYDLLGQAGSDAASAKTGTIVWHVKAGAATSGTARADVAPMLAKVSAVDGVAHLRSPLTVDGATQVSSDG